MIINDSNEIWEIVGKDGITIVVKPNDAYDPVTKEVFTIKKPLVYPFDTRHSTHGPYKVCASQLVSTLCCPC